MKPLIVPDKEEMILALRAEIRRSEQARYDHRLHGVLLVAEGLTCPAVAQLLGDAPRAVEYWVHRFDEHGFAGLLNGERCGRPSRLTSPQLAIVQTALRQPPSAAGFLGGLWDGKTLSAFLGKRFGVKLKVRQCQRLFRQLGSRLRNPRPLIAHVDARAQAAYEKTPPGGKRPKRRFVGHG